MSADEKVPAWLVMWECLCSDAQTNAEDLPVRCPGHRLEQMSEPERLDILARYLGVHECLGGAECGASS